jgi:predicted amidohydrolase YtcJ
LPIANCRLPIAFTVLIALFSSLALAQRPAADTIITNAKVYTVDKDHPSAEAVAIFGDRIVGVGSVADIDAWRGPDTKIIDAGGHLLLPGFNDAHVHFVDGGMQLDSVDLKDAATPQEFAKRIGDRVQQRPGEWVTGGDWDEQKWTPAQLPTRQLIDGVTGNTPVAVNRYDGHMVLANTAALRLAKITAKTPDPSGGVIVRDAQGNPTGALKDAAEDLIYKVIPNLTPAQRTAAVKRALAYAAQLGVTSVQHMNPSFDDVRTYVEMAERGELTSRIYVAPMETDWKAQATIGLRRAFGSPYLRMGAVKGYADGSLGATTAYFFDPYTDTPNTRGLLSAEMHPITAMRGRLMKADEAGLQLCIHAIGDQAISITLDMFSDIVKANGPRDRRLRIEHAQHMATKDFQRFADLGVIASVQPYQAIDDGRWAEKRIGPERAKTTYAFRTFLDHHVRLAMGTDWTVAPLDPLQTIYAAVTRATLDGKNPNGWVPEQKLTVAEAVEGYTMGSAYAEFQENEKGSISAGKLADMVLLTDDIFSIPPEAIKDTKVEKTMIGGKVVYERK